MVNKITLKWGTLKGYDFTGNSTCIELVKKYYELGSCISRAVQQDSLEQKELICQMIDNANLPRGVYLAWDGKYVTKEDAKKYVMEYGNG